MLYYTAYIIPIDTRYTVHHVLLEKVTGNIDDLSMQLEATVTWNRKLETQNWNR